MPILSELIESDVENSQDVLNSILSSPSTAPTPQVSKKPAPARKQQKSQNATRPKAAPKAKTGKAASAPAPKRAPSKKKAAGVKRKAVEEHHIEETERVGDTVDAPQETLQETPQPKSRRRSTSTKPRAKPAPQEPLDDMAEGEQSASNQPTKATANDISTESAPRPAKRAKLTSAQRPVQKTDPEPDASTEADAPASEPGQTPLVKAKPGHPRSASRQSGPVRQQPVVRRRAGSASDTERGDPGLRRKLGDITRKFENVEVKYRNLKEVGISEANANMEKLRQRWEASTLASNELIASLKKELAVQAPLARDSQKIRGQMHSQEAEMARLRTTATELAGSLAAAQNEIKALHAKLAAARASSVAADGRTPARESKREIRPALAPGPEAAQTAQMKEELYSDLTGLIVRSVKRSADGDTYDCIQTGRNGTLHFKLFVDAEDAKNTSFEETDFLYTPLLDANRDRDMIELMPTYLTEEITFARQNAAKFYGRVLDTLTKRRVDE
ncbi:hypothetical protein DV738_g4846, partial [Chaetothyriales sp. CBS 135597]